MNKIACQFSIIRFSPYVETGEFANVGIIMMSSKHRYFGFKLEKRRYGRITKFFDELEPKLYRESLATIEEEFQRIHEVLKAHGFDKRKKVNDIDFARQLFLEVVRPRESIVRFSEPRIAFAENPKEKLKEIFSYYIERNFVTKVYKETILEQGVRRWLNSVNVAQRFYRLSVGDDSYRTTFPFVEQMDNQVVKVIKPLHLAQEDPTKIIDHGGSWLFRLEELKRRGKMPQKTLFAVAGPEQNEIGRRQIAFEEIVGRLKETGIEVTDYSNRQQVLDFACN